MNKSEAKKRFKDLCYEKDLIECAKDTDFDKLIEEIFTKIAEDIPSVSPKRNPFRKPSNFNVGDMNGWDVCHVTWLDEIKQFKEQLLN